jgi:CIC family chloride channel protein
MGAMLGAATCAVERLIAPGVTGPMGAYALIGMGTMFAGTLRAPMTSVFMIVEVSGNYSIILPVMISNTLAYLVSRQFQTHALFDVLGRQDGTDLPSMEEERETAMHSVEDAMRTPEGVLLDGEESVGRNIARAGQVSSDFFLVTIRPGVWGGISRADLTKLHEAGPDTPLGTLVKPIAKPYLYPDQAMEFALRVLQRHPFVPVVHRADLSRLVGMLALDDVLRLYRAEPSSDHAA